MRNRMYGGVRGRKTKVGRKLLRFPPTRLYPDFLFKKCSLFTDNERALYVEHEISPNYHYFLVIPPTTSSFSMLCSVFLTLALRDPKRQVTLFLSNSTNDIIIFDAMLGFLDVGFKRPEAPSDGETERTGTIPRLLIIAIVTVDGLGL